MPRVLLVDDEPGVLRLMSLILTVAGLDTVTFEDPLEALAAFKLDPQGYAVLVTDLMMPGMGGAELASTILGIRAELPVVFVTGFVAAAAEAPGSDLLSRYPVLLKPQQIPLLKDTILGCLGDPGSLGATTAAS